MVLRPGSDRHGATLQDGDVEGVDLRFEQHLR